MNCANKTEPCTYETSIPIQEKDLLTSASDNFSEKCRNFHSSQLVHTTCVLKVLFFREHHQAIGFTRVFRLLQRAQKVSDVVGGIFIAVNVVMSFLICSIFSRCWDTTC